MNVTRRRNRALFVNPVLIGAVTVLVAIVAVFLAYNANSGLPFVPRYALHVQVRNSSELTHGAEVHLVGGILAGYVDSIDPGRDSAGQPIAVLNLLLNKSVQPLPVNTRFVIRLKGAIGLKYLEVYPGRSHKGWTDGATVPVKYTGATVDLDQVLSTYNAATRKGVAAATGGFAYGLAGRGSDLNEAIHEFLPLINHLRPVARNLASKKTDFGGFFRGLAQFSHAVAPVAQDQANLYVNLDTTFTALAGVAIPYLQEWISQTPPTEETVIRQAPVIRPFLRDTAALFAELLPGFSTLPQSAPVLTQAEIAGTKNLPLTIPLDAELTRLAITLQHFGENPAVTGALDRLTLTANSLHPPLRFLTPAQSTCNYITLFLRNGASVFADPLSNGTRLRFIPVAIDDVLGEESVPSQKPYLTPNTNINLQHGPLHVNPYPYTAAPGQPQVCAAGNESYSGKQASIGNPSSFTGTGTEVTKRSGG
ncbi:MAG: MlaD family protein [Solirubrobacteraceae bacterium]